MSGIECHRYSLRDLKNGLYLKLSKFSGRNHKYRPDNLSEVEFDDLMRSLSQVSLHLAFQPPKLKFHFLFANRNSNKSAF